MPVHTLDTIAGACAGPKPARLAVIGHPVAHSASPRMHQPALDEAGIDVSYVALEAPPGRVAEAFERLQTLGFLGCNVTVPHKFDALAACDEIDDTARALGAVNTVSFRDGHTRGTNTDGGGFERAIDEAFELELRGRHVLVVGAGGGAGSAIARHCARAGVARLLLVNRTAAKIEALAAELRPRHPQLEIETLASSQLEEPAHQARARAAELLVNASSLGLAADDPSPLPAACFTPDQAVFDSIYQPPRTRFLELAAAAGARTANGRAMLLHQGVLAFLTWFPGTTPLAAMRRGLGE